MQRWFETVFDTLTGAAISGAEVWLWNAADNSLATIYSDAAGTSPTLNPLTSDSNGFVECYPPDGLYRIEFKVAGVTLRTIDKVAIFDLADMRSDLNDLQGRMATAEGEITANTANITANTAALLAKLAKASNLSDLADLPTARTNLSVYSKAQVDAIIAGLPASGGGAWGGITGTLSDQADLQAALNGKLATGLALLTANDFSDLHDAPTARTNLSVYSKAQVDALIPVILEAARTKPLDANFTALNHQAGTTHGNTAKGCQITVIGGGTNIQGMVSTTAPDAANFTATFRVHRLRPTDPSGNQAVIFLRNSTNGRVIMWGDFASNQWLIQNWTSVSSFSGSLLAATAAEPTSFPWRRIRRVTTDLFYEASQDGENWGSVLIGDATSGLTVASFITATGGGNIDQVGFGVMSSGSTARIPLGTICTSFTLT